MLSLFAARKLADIGGCGLRLEADQGIGAVARRGRRRRADS